MKKVLVLSFLLSSFTLVFGQEFTGSKIKPGQWNTSKVLTYTSNNGQDQIQMVAVAQKVKRSKNRITSLKVNGTKYKLIDHWGFINVLDTNGDVVLKTDADREEIFLANNERFVKTGNRRTIQYLDSAGKLVVSGTSRNRNIILKKHVDKADDLLVALCLKELLLFEYEFFQTSLLPLTFDY